jgi:predicted RNA-binding protein YlqC (UPF0109 family)
LKDLILLIAQQLVTHPEAVEVSETERDTTSIVDLWVAKEDLGRVIGKQGRTAKSIRTIITAVASRTNRKVRLGMKKILSGCERCGKSGQDRDVDHVVDRFWIAVKVTLCDECNKNLCFADGPLGDGSASLLISFPDRSN